MGQTFSLAIGNIGVRLRENSLIVDQLAASIITLLTQLSGSRENARVSIGKHLPSWGEKAMQINRADVAELVDARDLKSLDGNVVWVRVPPPAPVSVMTRRSIAESNRGFCVLKTRPCSISQDRLHIARD